YVFFFVVPLIYVLSTLSLHDALPISGSQHPGHALRRGGCEGGARTRRSLLRFRGRGIRQHSGLSCQGVVLPGAGCARTRWSDRADRKSTRLNSSHVSISYAVFCLKKK